MPCCFAERENLWCHGIKAGVGSDCVVVSLPCVDDHPSVSDVAEQMLVEALLTEPTVEILGSSASLARRAVFHGGKLIGHRP
ncbi:hypothetical protein Amal_03164 [Acetobacter malorum]|uniref:Uncharacterized protein n=1 Tax=Acetobacter malorum TaxID=178901 RepID=A0A177G5Q7_9PROT|nr:hypothetical protein Amal_03164 [Acetobacter malorum]